MKLLAAVLLVVLSLPVVAQRRPDPKLAPGQALKLNVSYDVSDD